MNHPARNPLEEIDWLGRHAFDFVDFTTAPFCSWKMAQ